MNLLTPGDNEDGFHSYGCINHDCPSTRSAALVTSVI